MCNIINNMLIVKRMKGKAMWHNLLTTIVNCG